MKLVIIESPFAGDTVKNIEYGRQCMSDCFSRGEAPFASHLLYTQPGVLDDDNPEQRRLGIDAGLLWGDRAEATVVYTDLGISKGMQYGIDRANLVYEKYDRVRLFDPGFVSVLSMWFLWPYFLVRLFQTRNIKSDLFL